MYLSDFDVIKTMLGKSHKKKRDYHRHLHYIISSSPVLYILSLSPVLYILEISRKTFEHLARISFAYS
jgi:hypothetical protein